MDGPDRVGYVVTGSSDDDKKISRSPVNSNEIGSFLVVGFASRENLLFLYISRFYSRGEGTNFRSKTKCLIYITPLSLSYFSPKAADFAEAISRMSEEEAAHRFLQQLDDIFATPECLNPASSCNDGYIVHDWTKIPTIRGGYRCSIFTSSSMLPLISLFISRLAFLSPRFGSCNNKNFSSPLFFF